MKIIEDKYNKSIECEYCGSLFQFNDSDIKIGSFGEGYVPCPCCGERNSLEEYSITLTPDNLKFPNHFCHFSKEDCVEIDNEKILEWIRECISQLRKDKNCEYCFVSSGDTAVVVFNMSGDEEYAVYVAKDFYETAIPFEQIDY